MKLLLVDDHPLFLEGLQYLLQTHGIEVAGVAHNGNEAITKARELRPDIILMDIRMPECSGMDALKLIKAEMPEINIVMLTTSEEDEDLIDAIKFGAAGYLLKNTNAKILVDMLYDLKRRSVPLSPGLADKILKELKTSVSRNKVFTPDENSDEHRKKKLTKRQIEVLEMVADRKSVV